MIAHIPPRQRPQLADLFAAVCREIKAAPQGTAEAVTAFTKLLLFPAAILANSTRPTRGAPDVRDLSLRTTLEDRMQLWHEGRFDTLWEQE